MGHMFGTLKAQPQTEAAHRKVLAAPADLPAILMSRPARVAWIARHGQVRGPRPTMAPRAPLAIPIANPTPGGIAPMLRPREPRRPMLVATLRQRARILRPTDPIPRPRAPTPLPAGPTRSRAAAIPPLVDPIPRPAALTQLRAAAMAVAALAAAVEVAHRMAAEAVDPPTVVGAAVHTDKRIVGHAALLGPAFSEESGLLGFLAR
jgi:hypothetical protein